MNPYFFLLGHPYNPVSDEYFDSLPSKVKATGSLKKIIKNNYNSLSEENFVDSVANSLISFMEDAEPDKYLYMDFSTDDIDVNYYKEHIRSLYSVAKKSHAKGVNRLALSYLPPYQDSIDDYYSDSKGELTPKWLNPIVKENINEGLDLNLESGVILNPIETINDIEPYDLTDAETEKLKNMMLFVDNEIVEIELFSKIFLSKAIIYARKEDTYNKAINLVWCAARKETTIEIFLAFYSCYKEIFDEKSLPFLHIENLKVMTDKLTCERNRQLNTMDERKVVKLLEKISDISTDSGSIGAIFQIRKMISNDGNFPSQKNMIKHIQKSVNYLFLQYRENENTPAEIIDLINKTPELKISHIDSSNVSLFNELSEFLELVSSAHAVSVYLFKKKFNNNKPIKSRASLNNEAIKLGKNPLNHLERLQEISTEVNAIDKKEKEENKDTIRIFSSFHHNLMLKINSFNNQEYSKNEKVENNEDKLEDTIRNLKKEISMCKTETGQLKSTIHNKESIISTLESNNKLLSRPTVSNICSEEISSLLSSPSVLGVINIIHKIHGTIILSPKAKQELSNLTIFCKHDLLTQKLGILSSQKFIEAYTAKGSQACFEFLTNKELSFQESKTVKDRNERSFKFSDGKTRDCKAHLKICSSTKEQYQLRIYFKIEDKKLYVGMITKHLDC